MADLSFHRRDPLTGNWVIVAPERALAVQGGGPDPLAGLPTPSGPCPFCPGNEAGAGPAVAQWPAEGPWRIRSVWNRYPVARPDGATPDPGAGWLQQSRAFGRHEVIVEAPEHDLDLVDLGPARLADVLGAYRDRVRALEDDPRVAQVSLFRNRGRRAGSSQPHPHAQIAGLSILGPEQERRWARALAYHDEGGGNLLTDLLEAERADGARVLTEVDGFAALLAFAPQRNFETWVLPSDPRGSFADCDRRSLEGLARLLDLVLPAVLEASGREAYNLVLRLPPARRGVHPAAGWLLEIVPRGGGPAGFELVCGMALLTIAPEDAARAARARLADAPSL